jgi:hypothetical protein
MRSCLSYPRLYLALILLGTVAAEYVLAQPDKTVWPDPTGASSPKNGYKCCDEGTPCCPDTLFACQVDYSNLCGSPTVRRYVSNKRPWGTCDYLDSTPNASCTTYNNFFCCEHHMFPDTAAGLTCTGPATCLVYTGQKGCPPAGC